MQQVQLRRNKAPTNVHSKSSISGLIQLGASLGKRWDELKRKRRSIRTEEKLVSRDQPVVHEVAVAPPQEPQAQPTAAVAL